MKKITCTIVIFLILSSILTGCSDKAQNQPSTPPPTTSAPATPPAPTSSDSTKNNNAEITDDMKDFWMDNGEWFNLPEYAKSYGFKVRKGPTTTSPEGWGAHLTMYDEEGLEIRSIYFPEILSGSHVAIVTVSPNPNEGHAGYTATIYETLGMLPNDETINSGREVRLFDPSFECRTYAGTKLEALCELIKTASDLTIEDPISDIHERYGSNIGLYRYVQFGMMTQSQDNRNYYHFESIETITPKEKLR